MHVTGFSSVKHTVSPAKFTKIAKEQSGSIKHSRFIPPLLGNKNDFGKIEVEYFHATKR